MSRPWAGGLRPDAEERHEGGGFWNAEPVFGGVSFQILPWPEIEVDRCARSVGPRSAATYTLSDSRGALVGDSWPGLA